MNTQFRKIACEAGFSISQAYSAEFNEFSERILTEVFNALLKNEANLTVDQWRDVWWEINKHFGSKM